ncbi:hypothetical protein AB0K71_05300 [Streptomyces syringium]|uniref:hypothetical protein n=1 Tax=Streptomyces syringium TaxID=76729 RepID=UPI00342BCC5E
MSFISVARVPALLMGTVTAGALLLAGAGAAAAAPADEQDNGGVFLTGNTGTGNDTDQVAELAKQAHIRTPADKLCTGTWTHQVSTVSFQRAAGGTLAWSFKLSNQSRAALGPTVNVSMPYSYLNGKAINPPYGPHTEPNWYNFHGSLNKYQFVGGGGGSIQTGNKVTFYWFLKGSKPNTAANRYITCQIPKPGSA